MNYISLFSGIEAASLAFKPLGWEPIAFAEIEPFASAVLAHHYPDVPNVGDITAHDWGQYRGACSLVVGGPPCQAFSVAGLRQSLNDDRGNLSLEYVRTVRTIDPLWSVTENVPGWLSTRDNAFGCFLAALVGEDAPIEPPGGRWTDAGLVSGPERTAAWRILDAQFFGLAQRRRRVFVLSVRGADNWRCAAALFPVGASLRGDPPPRRAPGEGVAPTISARTKGGGGLGTDFDCDGELIPQTGCDEVASCLTSREHKGPDSDVTTTLIPILAAGAATANGAGIGRDGDPMFALDTTGAQAIAFHARQDPISDSVSLPLDTDGASIGIAVPVALRGRESGATIEMGEGAMYTLRASKGGGDKPHVFTDWRVRRLMPLECERLMGTPDGYTAIPYRGKLAADGNRYRALGNSMAVPCMAWIGRRIAEVDQP